MIVINHVISCDLRLISILSYTPWSLRPGYLCGDLINFTFNLIVVVMDHIFLYRFLSWYQSWTAFIINHVILCNNLTEINLFTFLVSRMSFITSSDYMILELWFVNHGIRAAFCVDIFCSNLRNPIYWDDVVFICWTLYMLWIYIKNPLVE